MFCTKCGTDVGDAKFCPNCGEKVEGDIIEDTCPPGTVKVNKIAYGIIAILLGDLGIHRFYARRWLSGILYLLFFWTAIPGILGLVEGILALVRQDEDEHGNIVVREGHFFI